MLRIVAWILVFTLLPVVLIVFLITHFALLLWLGLIVVIVAAIYGVVSGGRSSAQTGPR